jgi:hypothetical protein
MDGNCRESIIERAKSWRNVAEQLNDPFLKFITEYIAFNALIRAKYGYTERERTIINRLKREISRDVISSNKIVHLKALAPIRNVRNLRRTRQIRNRRNTQFEITAEDLNKIENVIEAVYWIRNNLFHGDKIYSLERDEKLVKISYEILVDINNWLLSTLPNKIEQNELAKIFRS